MDRRPMLIAGAAIAALAVVVVAWVALGGLGSGDPEPSPTASPSPSPSEEQTPSPSPTEEPTPSDEPTASPTVSPTAEPSDEAGPIEVAWSAAEGLGPAAQISGVAYLNGRWIAVGGTSEDFLTAAIWTSDDGATWTRAEIESTQQANEYTQVIDVAALDDGTLVAIGSWGVVPSDQFSRMVWRSTDDGATWTASRENQAAFLDIATGGPGLVAIESSGGGIGPARTWVVTSSDGVTWERTPMTFEAALQAIAVLDGRLVVAGGVPTAEGEADAAAWYSDDDGATWTAVEVPDTGAPEQILSLATFEGGLVATGDRASSWVTADGAAWEVGGIAPSSYAGAVAAVDGGFVAVGNEVGQDFGDALSWTSTDGLSWEAGVPFGTASVRMDAAGSSGGIVVAGGMCLASSCDAVLWWGEVSR